MSPSHLWITKAYFSTMLGSLGMFSFELSEINELNGSVRIAALVKFASLAIFLYV